jgi:integrase
MRKTLTDNGVAALKPRASRYTFPDPECRGHYIRVQPSGMRTFIAVTRDPFGKQVWTNLGGTDVLSIDTARDMARSAIQRIKAGQPAVAPVPVKPDTFKAVAQNWFQRHVTAKKLRSADEIKRCLEKYVYPHWADRDFVSKRSDVAALLDHIEDANGARQADLVLAHLRSIATWFSQRDDDYVSPFVRGMRRNQNESRSRILNDDELRVIWKAAESSGQFGAAIRLLLLTGQRREKIYTMKFTDISDGVWTIATRPREKGNAGSLALPPMALTIIESQTRLGENPFVFPGRGNGHHTFSQSKAPFDRKLPKMPHWQIHDLRRTSRSLLSRANVRPDISERVLGHAIQGVEGIYDRHRYDDEKAAALNQLAMLIDGIVNPRDNVLPMQKQKRAK